MIVFQRIRNAGIDLQAVQGRNDPQDVLAHAGKGPGCRAGQPAVFALSEGRRIPSRNHLAVDIGLHAPDVHHILKIEGTGLAEDFKGTVSVSEDGLGTGDPGIVVAENTRVLLVSRRIGSDLSQFRMVDGIGRLMQHDAVPGIQVLFDTLKGSGRLAGLDADTRHHAHALGFNVYFPFFADAASHRSGEGIIGADKPFSVPAGIQDDLFHVLDQAADLLRFLRKSPMPAQVCIFQSVFDKHARNEDALRDRPLAGAGRLEALSGSCGEAVQIQAVVPVGAADLGQSVGSPVVGCIPEAPAEVLHQGRFVGVTGIKGTHFIQNTEVSGLLDIGGGRRDQPEGVIIKAAADAGVAPLGEGLILVISASVLELGIGNINDTLSRPLRDQVDKTKEVLAGIAESHSPSQSALIIAGAAAHAEGDHALVLVPDIDHAVEFVVTAVNLEVRQKGIPVFGQCGQCFIHLGIRLKALQKAVRRCFIDDAGRLKLLLHGIFAESKHKDHGCGLSRAKPDGQVMAAHGSPPVRDAVAALSFHNSLGRGCASVKAYEIVPAGIKSHKIPVDRKDSIVIPSLPVFRLVIDPAAADLHLSCGEIALEIGRVILRVPQAELHVAEDIENLFAVTFIGESQPVDLTGRVHRHENFLLCSQPILLRCDHRVSEAVAAAVLIQFCLNRLPAGVPHGFPFFYIEIVPSAVHGTVVIAVTCQSQELCILIEAVAACRVGNQAEKVLRPEIIDPGKRCPRVRNHIFPLLIIKITVFSHLFLQSDTYQAFRNRFRVKAEFPLSFSRSINQNNQKSNQKPVIICKISKIRQNYT